MSKLIVGSAVAALALGFMATPGLAAETIYQQLEQGSANGVAYSYLTTNSSDTGATSDALWRIEGQFHFDWDQSTGKTVGTTGTGTLDVFTETGTTKVGELSIVSVWLDDTVAANSEYATVTFQLTGGYGDSSFDTLVDDDDSDGDGTTDDIMVGFLNKTYKGVFNSYGPTSGSDTGTYEMALWGNENQHNGGWTTGPNNWGLDWKSAPVPLPSPVLLGLAGLGMVGWVRRRRGN